MYKLIAALIWFCLALTFQDNDEVRMIFNSNREVRNYVQPSDTVYIHIVPEIKDTLIAYKMHNLSITFEGISNAKEKVSQTNILIKDTTLIDTPLIKIPLTDYIKNDLTDIIKLYIDIEGIQKVKDRIIESDNIPKSQLHREFIWSSSNN